MEAKDPVGGEIEKKLLYSNNKRQDISVFFFSKPTLKPT